MTSHQVRFITFFALCFCCVIDYQSTAALCLHSWQACSWRNRETATWTTCGDLRNN